jgi:two-component system chemotaxis response regulator CheY
MDDDLISLKMLLISEAASERELLRGVLSQASVPIDLVEIETARDHDAACARLAKEAFDAVLFDSRMPKAGRHAVLQAARAARGHPLTILIGAAKLKTREVLTDGLAVDGVLAKPIVRAEARELIANCVRARLPNRVLVVDGSSKVRSIICKVLKASRFRVDAEQAETGAAAIERANRRRFDIIFLDCNLPAPDGFATLDALKRVHPDAKVVMMTGTGDVRLEDRARAEGAKDFLYKPFFAKDIDAVLNRLFGLTRARWS